MKSPVNKFYVTIVLLLMLIFPLICIVIDHYSHPDSLILTTGKWFIFWALGIRLFTAGIRQVIKPLLTLQQIFHINDVQSHVIVKELGFANICMGLAAIISIVKPEWRNAAAFVGGLYMGIAGINHVIKKPVGANEVVAMVSDIFIFLMMAAYLCIQI